MIVIEKSCKYCQKIFIFDYECNGKGSGAKLKRPYCSDECKLLQKNSMKKVNLSSRVTKNCVVCNNEFFVAKSLIHRKCCSNNCRYKHTAKVATRVKVLNKQCSMCQKLYETKNSKRKFCSFECFGKSLENKHEFFCGICNKSCIVKKSYKGRFCSKACVFEAQSKGLIEIHLTGRTGYRSDIENSPYFKSSFEADYYRYCVQILKIKPLFETKTFTVEIDGITRRYTPDFWFENENRFVELKGVKDEKDSSTHFSRLMNSNSTAREKLREDGLNIDVIYMNDFYESLKDNGLYRKIENLENRNYGKTKHLVIKHNENPNN